MIDVIPTLHARMVRGTTKIIDRIYRDEVGRLVDLTGATIWYAIRADAKLDPTVFLTSKLPASLALGTLGTVVQAIQGGNDVKIALVADGTGAVVVNETLITSGLAQVNRLITVHFDPTVNTTAQLEAAINAQSTIAKIKTASSTPTYVLQNGDAMVATALAGGPPNQWRTGIVIDPDQNSFRGHYTITIVPSDTSALAALGDDDPWFHQSDVQLSNGTVNPDFGTSKMAVWPETTDVP